MKTAYLKRSIALLLTLILTFSCFYIACPTIANAASYKPAQVKSLKATPGTTYVKLTWGKVSSASGYAVFSYSNKTQKYTVLANVTTNSCTVKNLNSGTSYLLAVQAYTIVSGKRYYGVVSKNISTKTLSATPTQVKNLKAANIDSTTVKLKWTGITDAKYVIYSYNSKTRKYTKLGTSSKNTYTVKNLKAETGYSFAVRAYKAVSGKNYYGKYSAKLLVTTAPTPLKLAQARELFRSARNVYMNWVYSCNYVSKEHTITHEFYGMQCQFAAVEHDAVKDKSDLTNLLGKYFDESVYANELYLYLEVEGKLYGKLYYYAEGGKSDSDSLVQYYTDSLTKLNGTTFNYTLYPVYYDGVQSENLPQSFTYTIVRRNKGWVFTDRFYPCTAEIR